MMNSGQNWPKRGFKKRLAKKNGSSIMLGEENRFYTMVLYV